MCCIVGKENTHPEEKDQDLRESVTSITWCCCIQCLTKFCYYAANKLQSSIFKVYSRKSPTFTKDHTEIGISWQSPLYVVLHISEDRHTLIWMVGLCLFQTSTWAAHCMWGNILTGISSILRKQQKKRLNRGYTGL